MKTHLQPITKRAVANPKAAGNQKITAGDAKSKHANFTNLPCGCTGKCSC